MYLYLTQIKRYKIHGKCIIYTDTRYLLKMYLDTRYKILFRYLRYVSRYLYLRYSPALTIQNDRTCTCIVLAILDLLQLVFPDISGWSGSPKINFVIFGAECLHPANDIKALNIICIKMWHSSLCCCCTDKCLSHCMWWVCNYEWCVDFVALKKKIREFEVNFEKEHGYTVRQSYCTLNSK